MEWYMESHSCVLKDRYLYIGNIKVKKEQKHKVLLAFLTPGNTTKIIFISKCKLLLPLCQLLIVLRKLLES